MPSLTSNSSGSTEKSNLSNYRSPDLVVNIQSKEIGYSLFSNRDFSTGSIIYESPIYFSELRKTPDMHTIQATKDWHWCTKKHPIQFLQHACFQMNCRLELDLTDLDTSFSVGNSIFAHFRVMAIEDIKTGTVLTINYNSFEWEMSCSFVDAQASSDSINQNLSA